jgi:alanine-synthesizing transaminase
MTTAANMREIAPATRVNNVHYAIRDLAVLADEVAQRGHQILYLNIGDPLKFDFRTPEHMIDAVYKAMRDGFNGYASSSGVKSALEAIRADAERRGIRSIQDIWITNGCSEGVDTALTALLNPGEHVLTPSPEYPLYSAVIAKLGMEPTPYSLNEENGWEPDLRDIRNRITTRTRGIVLINPNNPTGAIYSRAMLEAIAEIAREHSLVVFADEIYGRLVLDGETHIPFASIAPDVPVVTFEGLSKGYLAPGWRVGWGIVSGPPALVANYAEAMNKLLRSRLCAIHPMQFAIPVALNGPQDHLIEVRAKLTARRDLTAKWADTTPRVSCVPPRGAFYAFPKLEIPEPDEVFVRELLVQKHVLVVHGSGFGQAPETHHIRIVFLPDEPTLNRAYADVTDFMRERYS